MRLTAPHEVRISFGSGSLILLALLQTWHELDFSLGRPEDIDAFPWSAPVSVLVSLLIALLLWIARKNYRELPELPPVTETAMPDVSVVIAVCQHEESIARCVRSLRPARVIVVTDDSRDGALGEAKAAGAEVIPAPVAPRGVLAKPNALSAGAQNVTANYVLFADADTRFEPNFLASAVQYAGQNELVLLSPFLKQHCVSFRERMLTPYASALYFCGVNARKAQDELSPSTYANGQCMLFLRTAFEFFGGYRSVQTSPSEDIAIAQKVKRHRMKLRIMRAEHLGSVHRKWSNRGTLRVLRPSGKTSWRVVFASLLLTSIVPVAVWLGFQEQWPFLLMLLAIPVVALTPWYGGWSRALLYLPGVYLFQWLVMREFFSRLFRSKNDRTPR